ncbi:DUF305 domain-containing protein [Kribbella sp. NPDC051718]|uniref:DUF305 domain-containing protein n=1 Tax=Kribbella sp. NPDC051718 TaxID=3155168 RepID=UPI003413B58F
MKAFACAVLLVALTGCGSSAASTPPAAAPPPPTVSKFAVNPSFNATDLAWIELMIPMDDQLIRVLGMAQKQAADPAVRTLATQVSAGHKTEVAQFVALRTRANWPAKNPHEGHDMPGMMTEPEIVTLGKTKGAAFDQLFEKNLKEHLDQSIVLARSITTDGKDAETKKLAAAIMTSRAAQLKQLAGL